MANRLTLPHLTNSPLKVDVDKLIRKNQTSLLSLF